MNIAEIFQDIENLDAIMTTANDYYQTLLEDSERYPSLNTEDPEQLYREILGEAVSEAIKQGHSMNDVYVAVMKHALPEYKRKLCFQ